jgi:hypothetical protein
MEIEGEEAGSRALSCISVVSIRLKMRMNLTFKIVVMTA